jgi:hypothetical protein
MLSDIPDARVYFINPLRELDSTKNRMFESDKLIEVGGVGVLNELSSLVDDSKQVLVMGISNDKCLIFLNMNDIECVDIVNRAKLNYDVKAGKILDAPKDSTVVE